MTSKVQVKLWEKHLGRAVEIQTHMKTTLMTQLSPNGDTKLPKTDLSRHSHKVQRDPLMVTVVGGKAVIKA